MPKVSAAYKESRRAKILECAYTCFSEKGYQSTSIDDIALKLGGSKGQIYTYFGSKEDIWIQIMEQASQQMIDNMKQKFEDLPNATSKLQALFKMIAEQPLQALRPRLVLHLDFITYTYRKDDGEKYSFRHYDAMLTFVSEIVQEGIISGEFSERIDPAKAAELFWAVRDGLAVHFLVLGDQTSYQEIIKSAEVMMFQYLQAHK